MAGGMNRAHESLSKYSSLIIACAVFLAGCTQPGTIQAGGNQTQMNASAGHPQELVLATSDHLRISALLSSPSNGSPKAFVILLHSRGGSKEDYQSFSNLLVASNYSVLAIDFRGHGESAVLNQRSYQDFSPQDYAGMAYDAGAAFGYVRKLDPGLRVFIIGSSIGANTALVYSSGERNVSGVALLSPGTDYMGVFTNSSASGFGRRPLFIAASKEDSFSYDSSGRSRAWLPGAGLT
jgi:pimeloyl-ACP methyl ester carboxylesterase